MRELGNGEPRLAGASWDWKDCLDPRWDKQETLWASDGKESA